MEASGTVHPAVAPDRARRRPAASPVPEVAARGGGRVLRGRGGAKGGKGARLRALLRPARVSRTAAAAGSTGT